MATLEVGLEAPAAAFFAQEPMVVRCWLRNTGDAALEMPRASEPPPFEFQILTPEGEELQLGSLRLKEAVGSPHPIPRRNPPMDRQPPGATVRYSEDLNMVLPEALLPGKYRVQAIYQPSRLPLRSDLVPIEVLPPRHGPSAQALDGTQRSLWTARVVPGPEGGKLQLWDADLNRLPVPPAFENLGPFPEKVPLASAVMAVEAAGEGVSSDWRWLVWIGEANTLHGGQISSTDYGSPISPIRAPRSSAHIEGPGFQLDDGRGVFLVAGGDGSRSLALIDTEGVVRWLPLGSAFTARGVAQPTLWFQPVDEGEEQRPAELSVTWLGTGGQLYSGRVDPLTGATKRTPAPVYTAPAPVVTWQAPPYPRARNRTSIQIVVRTPDRLSMVEVGFYGIESAAVALPVLPEKTEEPARWVLPQRATAGHPVAIVADGQAWWTLAGASGPWRPLNDRPMDEASLRLWAIHNEATMAVWTEPGWGWLIRRLTK